MGRQIGGAQRRKGCDFPVSAVAPPRPWRFFPSSFRYFRHSSQSCVLARPQVSFTPREVTAETEMKMFTFWRPALALAGMIAMGAAQSVSAQVPSEFTVVASGLNAPRGLKFGPDGGLYVAESGTGGTNKTTTSQCAQVPGPVGPYAGGNTGAIVKISRNGKVSAVASGFPSNVASTGDLPSVSDVTFLNGQIYALLAGGGCSHGSPKSPNGIARVNVTTGKGNLISDLSVFEMTHPGRFDDAADFSAMPAPGYGAGRILRFDVAYGY
ncbi:MAG TPA: ScyD/ScyE family protein [Steroidobacteraceae bacterium]|jgi:hypothetical protein